MYARLWRDAGADVLVYSPRPLHERRASETAEYGIRVTSSLVEVQRFHAPLAHLHHAAPSPGTLEWAAAFSAVISREAVVLTHNVFGQVLPLDLGDRTVVGVLGHWVGAQYRFQGGGPAKRIRVLPNPQDLGFFRPPTVAERRDARAALHISGQQHVVLRVGSPTDEKWSRAGYASLVDSAQGLRDVAVRLIGAPVSHSFGGQGVTVLHEPLDDLSLRREYWAADVFAHWSERGESFGNVVLEALGTGLPVVYRAVRTRDNTPAEFRDLPGFEYVTRPAEWVRRSLALRGDSSALRRPLVERYDASAIRAMLGVVVDRYRGDADELLRTVLETLPRPRRLSVADSAAVAIRHNPLAAVVKRRRLRGAR